ncbi:MAG: dTDP-4-dehydrorhamnose 3,5-epimerase [Candidatus Aenigmatarchaeota archaeon]
MPIKKVEKIFDLLLIEWERFYDDRGFFEEIMKKSELKKIGIEEEFVQANISFSKKGTIRGLHYQLPPYEQSKLIVVIKGKIYDVAVDIRKSSKNFGKFYYFELSEEKPIALWIPKGYAHGFQALEDTILLYFVTKEYNKEFDRSINPFDKNIGIQWPLENYIISEKDKNAPSLNNAEVFE